MESTCPTCTSPNVYPDETKLVCADCGHEWSADAPEADAPEPIDDGIIRDSNGTPLVDGDSVVLIKALKVKGSSITLKQGTKIKNIRLTDGDHEVDCKIDNSAFMLKACYLRKST